MFIIRIPVILSLIILQNFFPVIAKDELDEWMSHLQLIHSNDWNTNVSCPPGQFISGIKLRLGTIQNDLNQTVRIVNGFKIFCTDSDGKSQNDKPLFATFGRFRGFWGEVRKCEPPKFALGVSATLTPSAHTIASLVEFRLLCSGSSETEELSHMNKVDGSLVYLPNGFRKYYHFCNEGQAVSGLDIQADSIVAYSKGDLSTVKGMSVHCRKILSPAIYCTMKLRLERIHGVRCTHPRKELLTSLTNPTKTSNLNRVLNCTFDTFTGIQPHPKVRNVNAQIKLHDADMSAKKQLEEMLRDPNVSAWYKTRISSKRGPTVIEEFLNRGEMWKTPANYSGNLSVKLNATSIPANLFGKLNMTWKHTATVDQFMAECGLYRIGFNMFQASHQLYFEQKINKRLTRFALEI